VSDAHTITFLFIWFFASHASLAIEVVFPAPLTPATMMTVGPAGAIISSRVDGSPQPETSSSRKILPASSWLRIFPSRQRSRISPMTLVTLATPMSARISFSSVSVRKASSICRPGMKSVRTSVFSTSVVLRSALLSLSRVFEKKAMTVRKYRSGGRKWNRR
jgi:hypothetical protein